jgi:glycosyltransferase involved in cell wall biosynthesis
MVPHEIIVVVDGSTDNTLSILASWQDKLPHLKVIVQSNKGRAVVRNTGVQEASGTLIIFLDDDMIATNAFIERHVIHHNQVAGSILTGISVLGIPDAPNEFSKYRNWKNRVWTEKLKSSSITDGVALLDVPFISAANCSMPKSVFSKLEGFDVTLRDAEDFDLAIRAQIANVQLFFSTSAVAINNDDLSQSCAGAIRRLREYTNAQIVLRKKKENLYKGQSRYQVCRPTGIKGKIYKLFCYTFWIRSVDINYWTWIPSSLRFKLYDIIITANGSYFPERVKL